eukprot:TRINITY_DN31047_c0_g1_i1.p1 TRINITY_DN31047_c0_g1~~TRINITY_DN31047_c0_g1_i1.p1  ORF type:complete len:312 (+),score=41.73 TRINITY_DN31047_c0_g1_i1:66-1001(+)
MGNSTVRCCGRIKGDQLEDDGQEPFAGTNSVELAATQLFNIPALGSAYHTSVIVNGEEFFFSDSGIFTDRMLSSHEGKPSERIHLGNSRRTGLHVLHVLRPHFKPGTYDLLRKNCNSFSDCALRLLLGTRLEGRFSRLERLGQHNAGLVQTFTKGAYEPNKAAADFNLENVIAQLDNLCSSDLQGASLQMPVQSGFSPGDIVTIIGLKKSTHLNGKGAQIVRYNAVNGRWELILPQTGETKSLRAENIRPAGILALEPGSRVRVHGLQSETGKALNGLEGTVVRYNLESMRYDVDVNGTCKALKAENLQAL